MKLHLEETIGSWFEENKEEIKHVEGMLAEPLPAEPTMLDEMLRRLDSEYARMNSLYAETLSYYYVAKRLFLKSRKDKWTDLDREIHMRADTITERRLRDVLAGIVDAIKSKLILGMSIRKSYVSEAKTTQR